MSHADDDVDTVYAFLHPEPPFYVRVPGQSPPSTATAYLMSYMMHYDLPAFMDDRRARRAALFRRRDASWTGNPGFLLGSYESWRSCDGDDCEMPSTIWYQYEGGPEHTLDDMTFMIMRFLGRLPPQAHPCSTRKRVALSIRQVMRQAADDEPHGIRLWQNASLKPFHPL